MTSAPLHQHWTDTEFVVTDGGLETWLVFLKGVDLPAFAAYPLAMTAEGRALLAEYYEHYAAIARDHGADVVLEAPTWRANPDWAATLGHDSDSLADHIAAAVDVVAEVRRGWTGTGSFLIGGTVGPRGDGYRLDDLMDIESAVAYHSFQIERLAAAGADVVTGVTIGYVEEAVGIALAAAAAGLPSVISFTVETDGRLPSGMTLADAIATTDEATSSVGAAPLHYMVNCAHPTHFDGVLDGSAAWAARIGGLRANASKLSHAELDEMVELDDGDPAELAAAYVGLRTKLPGLKVVGGCCGTDERHVAAIAAAWSTSVRS
jgi:homocysteine S-methyltransferase